MGRFLPDLSYSDGHRLFQKWKRDLGNKQCPFFVPASLSKKIYGEKNQGKLEDKEEKKEGFMFSFPGLTNCRTL